MLSIWKAALLGMIQGATEFLPVSSSGHLVVMQQLLGWSPDHGVILAFDIALHVGTLASVVAVFWRDIIQMITGKNWKLVGYLVLATVPAVIVGFTLKDWFEGLYSSVITVGVAWIITGILLILTRTVKMSDRKDVGWLRSFIIGCAQAVAIIPGISRSGSTIAAGLFLKIDRAYAAKFAFLMSIPAIAGGAVLDAKDLAGFPKDSIIALVVGVVAAALVGYICIKWLLRIISRGHLWWFGVYCLCAGVLTLVLTAL
jgi:undecaprenyl-diphosphatase